MKKMIALIALAFFGLTATCGMSLAASTANCAPAGQQQQAQDPAMHQQKKQEKVKHEKKAASSTKKHEKKVEKKQEAPAMSQPAPAAAQE